MIEQLHKPAERSANRQRAAHWLSFRRFLKNPVGVASVTPSSPTPGRLVAQHVCPEADESVFALALGTCPLTRALRAFHTLPNGSPPVSLSISPTACLFAKQT